MRIVLVGPPGAGKGTQAQYIAANLSIPAVSTGDIFRANVSQGTPLGREAKTYMDAGNLVPDEVTIGMVRERLAQPDVAGGFLLDGFPRNTAQAKVLDEILAENDTELDVVLELKVEDSEIIQRISGRRQCRANGHVCHILTDAPKVAGICDECGSELYQRDDDREETVRHRLDVYKEQTEPLVGYYSERNLLLQIQATGPVKEVTERAMTALREFGA
ncbi:adenylate kinase [Embleya hyalina]|uniref:Adenylate kinase n=1 Tax=Embleya hyalina TaxID=516124 RepID=A0A401YH39_9ACTN|nr:adenylate kinase [Embleya hyalina]GCD93889.1 adenylate kinase [Embleya hyalina]